MPLPSDEKVIETSKDIVQILHGLAGSHPGFRPVHAKGALLTGTFTPTAAASSLSIAKHFNDASTPVTVRFSSSTGLPKIPDTDPNSQPSGFAVRFHLGNDAAGKRVHTDIISHSTPFFPARTGEEFLQLFQAIAASGPGVEHPTPLEQLLGHNPKALAFIQAPKPAPESLANQRFFSVNAFRLVDGAGKATYVRYRIEPVLGVKILDEAALKERMPDFLFDDIRAKAAAQTGPVVFKLNAQVAKEGDITDDATEHWPEERKVVELGEIKLDAALSEEESLKSQKNIIFDPIPRVEGVEPSSDPLLEVRAGVYLLSGRERRAA